MKYYLKDIFYAIKYYIDNLQLWLFALVNWFIKYNSKFCRRKYCSRIVSFRAEKRRKAFPFRRKSCHCDCRIIERTIAADNKLEVRESTEDQNATAGPDISASNYLKSSFVRNSIIWNFHACAHRPSNFSI